MHTHSIHISVAKQTLQLKRGDKIVNEYIISTAANGIGSEEGSYCTPIGNFIICEKHGFNAPSNTIFKSRKPEGVWQGEPDCGDLVLSRILWLQGIDSHNLNSKQRYIYIHGTNHEDLLGSPHSCGCVRMRNSEVIELYNKVPIYTRVHISKD